MQIEGGGVSHCGHVTVCDRVPVKKETNRPAGGEDNKDGIVMADIRLSSLSGLSQLEFIRQETPKVVIGGVCTGIAGMTIGSLLAAQKNQPATLPALSMCLKTTSFGTAFFALRQFIVNPILHINQFPSTSSTSNRHFHGLLPTGISVAITGGSVNGYCNFSPSIFEKSPGDKEVENLLHLPGGRQVAGRKRSRIESFGRLGLNPAWWESYIPLSKISDKEWKERILVHATYNTKPLIVKSINFKNVSLLVISTNLNHQVNHIANYPHIFISHLKEERNC
ncbi:hypothetical protein PSTT_10522 [Puccinia striiformis]|uniref:Uncharacterized protein n=1 Tax=Puccinia striiformis TaxID=27350 RepID=A0A2S4V416_9BASI|nr:hypothetical protein PSTT_10522 [Puccinia striiformis]